MGVREGRSEAGRGAVDEHNRLRHVRGVMGWSWRPSGVHKPIRQDQHSGNKEPASPGGPFSLPHTNTDPMDKEWYGSLGFSCNEKA